MRLPLTVMIIAIAMLASPHAYGQAGKGQIGTQGTSGKPSGPAVGGGDRTLIPPTQPALAPPSDSRVISPAAATPTPIMCRLRSGQKNPHGIA